jgi:hypothetical protein
LKRLLAHGGGLEVKQLSHDPKFHGSNPTTLRVGKNVDIFVKRDEYIK